MKTTTLLLWLMFSAIGLLLTDDLVHGFSSSPTSSRRRSYYFPHPVRIKKERCHNNMPNRLRWWRNRVSLLSSPSQDRYYYKQYHHNGNIRSSTCTSPVWSSSRDGIVAQQATASTSIAKRLSHVLAFAMGGLTIFPTRAMAAATAGGIFSKRNLFRRGSTTAAAATPTTTTAAASSSAISNLFTSVLTQKRKIIQSIGLAFIITFIIRYINLRKRQSIDATSEWSRYANNPFLRARAVGSLLCLQILPLWLATRFLYLLRQHNIAKKLRTKTGNVFADGLLRLGPLYIKMGQILSCRDNLFPPEWAEAMEKLQDQVPSRRGQDAMNLAYEAIGSKEEFDKMFEDFDLEPLAAASLGQVHKAVLKKAVRRKNDDTEGVVAVKIQRSKLRQIYDQDLVVMNQIAAAMDKIGSSSSSSSKSTNVGGIDQSWTDIFSDAEEILYREIDYRDEANNARRFADDFGIDIGGKPLKSDSSSSRKVATSKDGEPLPSAAPWLRTPYVYTDLSSEKVLIMEFVPSIKITNKAKLDDANVTWEEREYLSDMLARAYLRQFCCNLFFSTDPHPGNLGVEIREPSRSSTSSSSTSSGNDNRRVRLVFYDFGQAASLNENQADGILDIIEAIVDMDVERSVDAFQTMGVLKEDANLDKVRAKVAENYRTGKVKANRKKLKRQGYRSSREREESKTSNATATNSTANTNTTIASTADPGESGKDSEVMKFFSLPAEYAFVARALSQMDGVGKTLDPEFDFVSSAAPHIVEIKGTGKYLKDEFKKRLNSFLAEFRSPYGNNKKIKTKV